MKGDLSESEMKECDALIKTSSEFSKRVNQIRKTYLLFDNLEAQHKINTQLAWQNLNKRIKRDSFKKTLWIYSRNIAAIMLPFILLYNFIVIPLTQKTPIQEIITLYSAPGVITKCILPDGSEVWLNAQSELSYPNKFDDDNRTVNLVGEAYFKVVSDPNNRFNVVTPDNSVISAYGTEFNVNAYEEYDDYSITLAEGNVDVAIDNLDQVTELVPGQKALINLISKDISVSDADAYVETAWKDGKMVFRRENIASIATKLSRRFGVIINIEGVASTEDQFTATFTNETLEEIMELLKLSTSIDYNISIQEKQPNDTYSKRAVTIKCK